mmetsp:Transcript_8313/g.16618  ORF Transcript_8313/g.16618 Transcript_8313/m.16618 type:complete len:160 (-) Transcript_8313:86-565(-)
MARGAFVLAFVLFVAPATLAFQAGSLPSLARNGAPRSSSLCLRRSGMKLRMSSSPPEPTQEEPKAESVDPYAVQPEVPGFAKQENQWELDSKAAKDGEDEKKKSIAIVSGVVAAVLSIAYLAAVVALESRGPLQPPPPEALQSTVPLHGAAALVAMLPQ